MGVQFFEVGVEELSGIIFCKAISLRTFYEFDGIEDSVWEIFLAFVALDLPQLSVVIVAHCNRYALVRSKNLRWLLCFPSSSLDSLLRWCSFALFNLFYFLFDILLRGLLFAEYLALHVSQLDFVAFIIHYFDHILKF